MNKSSTHREWAAAAAAALVVNKIWNTINKFNLQHTRRSTFIYAAFSVSSSSAASSSRLLLFCACSTQNKQQQKSLKLQVACFMAAGLQNLSHLPRFLMRRNKFERATEREREIGRETGRECSKYFINSQLFISYAKLTALCHLMSA